MLEIPKLHSDDEIRFWSKVMRKPDSCWIWLAGCNTGSTPDRSRPMFKIKDTNYVGARIAWMIKYKEDPGDKLVCHTCKPERGKPQFCVNPDHLWLGTYSENSQDAADKGMLSTNNRSNLSDGDVIKIRALSSVGMTPTQIGLIYRLTRNQIWRIVTGRSHNHLPLLN